MAAFVIIIIIRLECELGYHVDALSKRITLQTVMLSLCTRVRLEAHWITQNITLY